MMTISTCLHIHDSSVLTSNPCFFQSSCTLNITAWYLPLRRNEQQWEEKLPGGWRKGYRSESITYFGAQPAAPMQLQSSHSAGLGNVFALFALATLIGAYAAVAAALMRSYKHTK